MNIQIDHTIGDTDPLLVRLIKNGIPSNIAGASSIEITVTPVNKTTPKYIDGGTCIAAPAFGTGAIQYNWQPADALIPAGIKEAKVVVVDGGTKTYPTNRNFNFLIDFITGV